jgi:hypothetical protein
MTLHYDIFSSEIQRYFLQIDIHTLVTKMQMEAESSVPQWGSQEATWYSTPPHFFLLLHKE